MHVHAARRHVLPSSHLKFEELFVRQFCKVGEDSSSSSLLPLASASSVTRLSCVVVLPLNCALEERIRQRLGHGCGAVLDAADIGFPLS